MELDSSSVTENQELYPDPKPLLAKSQLSPPLGFFPFLLSAAVTATNAMKQYQNQSERRTRPQSPKVGQELCECKRLLKLADHRQQMGTSRQ